MRELRLWAAATAAPAVAAAFSLLAEVRRRRSLHPVGAGYRGWFVVDEEHPDRHDVPLFQPGRAATAVLRFSRAAGLPEPLPDAFGVAVKLPDVYGPGADQDLLLTSSIDRPLLRRLLFPATSFLRRAYSSALPYELGGGRRRIVLLLVPKVPGGDRLPAAVGRRHGNALAELAAATAAGLQFQLRTAGSFGPSQPLATLTIGSPLSPEETAQLRFNPWTTGPGIRPSGWINLLRDTAYRASQRAGAHTARRSPAHQTAAPEP